MVFVVHLSPGLDHFMYIYKNLKIASSNENWTAIDEESAATKSVGAGLRSADDHRSCGCIPAQDLTCRAQICR